MPSTCSSKVSHETGFHMGTHYDRIKLHSPSFWTSLSLSTFNSTGPFGSSNCSTGSLQLNASTEFYGNTCTMYRQGKLMSNTTESNRGENYTAELSQNILSIRRTFYQNYDQCRSSWYSKAVNNSWKKCHDTWTFYAPPPAASVKGAVSIQSRESGMCLDLPRGDTTNGNRLVASPCLGNKNQQWQFQELPVPRLVYAPSLESDNPKCVDLKNCEGDCLKNGQPLRIWDCENTQNAHQNWAFDPRAGLVYLLQADGEGSDGKCFDLRDGGMKNGTGVQVWDCAAARGGLSTGWKQQWSLSSSTSLEDKTGMNIIV